VRRCTDRVACSFEQIVRRPRIEAALREWRQGDATLDAGTFIVHLADKRAPLTAVARDAVDEVPAEYNCLTC
jgi:hypothetical protein